MQAAQQAQQAALQEAEAAAESAKAALAKARKVGSVASLGLFSDVPLKSMPEPLYTELASPSKLLAT